MRATDLVFFLSGAAGLVYESIWGRQLHLVFGTSQFAIATVLAAFMTGLAIGGALASRWAPSVRRPLRVYAALELIIGAFALCFPTLLDAISPIYTSFYRAYQPGLVTFGTFQFLLVATLLAVPTACMGATLPVLLRLPTLDESGTATGRLYGINTAGAVLGVWLAGFYLLPDLGVHATTLLAAGTNVSLAIAAIWLDHRTPAATVTTHADGTGVPISLLAVGALAGASSLAMEVAWFRLLTLILGGSVYAFTVMLLAFLVGIASGGGIGGTLADRLSARGRLPEGIAAAQIGVATLSYAAMWLYGEMPITFVRMYWVLVVPAPELLWPMKCVLAMMLMTPAAICMGLTFPLLVRAAAQRDLSAAVGQVYAANTLGSIFGAFGGGFVLLPLIRVTGTAFACIGLNLVAATIAVRGRSARAAGTTFVVSSILLAWAILSPPPWDPMWMTTGVYKYVDNLKAPTPEAMQKQFIDRYKLRFYEEGLTSVVTVAENRSTGNVWLANNGKIDASTTTDMPTQVLVAHLPFLFTAKNARDAVVIGLASGVTLGAATLHDELTRIDVIEIEPAIRRATEFFLRWNHRALYDPRVRLIANDGRNELFLTPPATYDIVIAEPSNPWLTGVSNLFTREFFEMGKARVKPGGVWSQWVQMYGMDSRDLRAVMRTFCQTWPYVRFFSTIQDADLVMIGSASPLLLNETGAREWVHQNNGLEAEFGQIGIHDEYDLLSHYLFDRDTALALSEGVPENTDDNLLVEFSAPHNLHRETSGENFLMLLPKAATPLDAIATADGLIRLAEAYDTREDTVRALIALKEAERREPGRDDTLEHYNRYQRKLKEQIR